MLRKVVLILCALGLGMTVRGEEPTETRSVIFYHQPDTVRHEWHIWAVCEGDTIYTFYVPQTQLRVGDTIVAEISEIQTNECATWRTFIYYDDQEMTSTMEPMRWTGIVQQPGKHEMGWGVIVYHTTGKVSDKFISIESIHVLE